MVTFEKGNLGLLDQNENDFQQAFPWSEGTSRPPLPSALFGGFLQVNNPQKNFSLLLYFF